MPLAQIRSVESFAQQTAERRGPKCCRKMKTPAGSTLFSIRIIRTSSLHHFGRRDGSHGFSPVVALAVDFIRSEEHTSELQSHHDLVCRLLLEKKKKKKIRSK